MKRLLEKIALFFIAVWDRTVSFFKGVSKKTYGTLAIFLLCALLLVDVGYHLVGGLSPRVETMPARKSTLEETLSLNVYLLRDEAPVNDVGGRYVYYVEDGEKVREGTPLAAVYDSGVDSALLDTLSAYLEAERLLKSVDTARLEKLSESLDIRIAGILAARDDALAKGELAKANRQNETLSVLMLCREELAGTHDVHTVLTKVTGEIQRLKTLAGSPVRTVNAHSVGWFSHSLDGYEGVATASAALDMSFQELLSLFAPREVSKSDGVGKMISSHVFRLVAFVSGEDAINFSLNKKYSFTVEEKTLTATLEKTVYQNGDDRVALIFSASSLAESFSLSRVFEATLVKQAYEGIKLPTAALVELDGVYGVYVLKGFVVEFREIRLLFREDSTVIVAEAPTDTSGLHKVLAPNDNVIIKGEDLYDGKILKHLS